MDVPYFYHHQQYLLKKSTIYHVCLGYVRNSCWSETYIHFSFQRQLFLPYLERKSGWFLVTQIHIYQLILSNYERNSGWSNFTYIHDLYNYLRYSDLSLYTCAHDFHGLHDYLRKSGQSQETYSHEFSLSKTLKYLLLQKFYNRHCNSGRKNGWSYETNILELHQPPS